MVFRLLLALGLATLLTAEVGSAAPSPNPGRTPSPDLGRTALVNTVGGTVLVKDQGDRRFTRLSRSATLVRMGAVLDAKNGRVRVRTDAGAGRPLNDGVFWQGAFNLSQARRAGGLTQLTLVGSSFRGCAGGARASRVVRRRLWGNAHGNFRSHGHNGSGTVRGTEWLTEDRCDGTLTAVRRGTVRADANGQLPYDVDAGETVQYFCGFNDRGSFSGEFCTAVHNSPAEGFWAAGIGIIGDASSYDLCLSDPTGDVRCGTFAFDPPENGVRAAAVACTTDRGPGQYSLRWRIGGVQLGPAIGFVGTQPPMEFICVS